MRLAALLLPLLLTGCLGADGLGFASGGDAPREPYYKEHREIVSGEHARSFELPIEATPNRLNATLLLQTRTNGLPLPDAMVAQLRVTLLDPAGEALGTAAVDGRRPQASLVVEDLAPGSHAVLVEGVGAAPELDGRTYGAGYILTLEVEYAG